MCWFEGTLLELFEKCAEETIYNNPEKILQMEQYIHQQREDSKILPIRKFAGLPKRGETKDTEGVTFLSTDNEPLCWLIANWKPNIGQSIAELLTSKNMPASWKCDVESPSISLRYSGVSTEFRKRKLKLAHIENAGMVKSGVDGDFFYTRFIRFLAPSNVFLFPSPRAFEVVVEASPDGLRFEQHKDLSEDPSIRALAAGWLQDKLKNLGFKQHKEIMPELEIPENWKSIASTIKVKVFPRIARALSQNNPTTPKKRSNNQSGGNSGGGACGRAPAAAIPKVPRNEAKNIDDTIAFLKSWRSQHPTAYRLDGQSQPTPSNPTPWVHVKVDRYTHPQDDFRTTHTRETFHGNAYNGTPFFPGDARWEAIELFINAYDAGGDPNDVLRPSATHETRNALPQGAQTQNKSLRLNGLNGVGGFYLYYH
jgi:hypothetical protein